jgi:hypothetical protein
MGPGSAARRSRSKKSQRTRAQCGNGLAEGGWPSRRTPADVRWPILGHAEYSTLPCAIDAQGYSLGIAEIEEGPMITTLKIISPLVAFCAAFSSSAPAENCKAIPVGPERRACVARENPGMFEQTGAMQTTRQGARRHGSHRHRAGGMREFVQDCMRGKKR